MARRGKKYPKPDRRPPCPKCGESHAYPVTNYGFWHGEYQCLQCRYRWDSTNPARQCVAGVKQ